MVDRIAPCWVTGHHQRLRHAALVQRVVGLHRVRRAERDQREDLVGRGQLLDERDGAGGVVTVVLGDVGDLAGLAGGVLDAAGGVDDIEVLGDAVGDLAVDGERARLGDGLADLHFGVTSALDVVPTRWALRDVDGEALRPGDRLAVGRQAPLAIFGPLDDRLSLGLPQCLPLVHRLRRALGCGGRRRSSRRRRRRCRGRSGRRRGDGRAAERRVDAVLHVLVDAAAAWRRRPRLAATARGSEQAETGKHDRCGPPASGSHVAPP